MTLKAITRLAFALTLALTTVACSSSRKTGSVTSRFPGGVKREGSDRSTRYPDGYPLPIPGTSTSRSTKGMPPGQAKKVYGDKSAKAYAPGQQKKKGHGKGNGKGKGKGKGKKH
ncbi:hypothetical protein GU926_04630 [Nibribacter ruber]|uniref:Quinol oxidase subunit 4 n=1 Tax=Nibribacter ruber TaxID=2698458 RepID=A0A6P1NYD1_9BACT|nr:hypothetical protein [Nibribacter ruber]QHL86761.1 hypothetical protein GU926_04630 [Nibribacter ruber]